MKNKKSVRKIIFIIVIACILIPICLFALKGTGIRGKLIACYKAIAVDTKIDLDSYGNFTDNNTAWYQQYKVIAHGLGEVEGHTTTNTLEAFEKSYKNGIRVFEADISKTIDGVYVLSHEFDEFEKQPSQKEFFDAKIKDKFTPLSLDWITECLVQNPDIYIMTDIKSDEFIDILSQIVAQTNGNEEILERLIIQVYSKEDLENMQSVYPFSNIVFSAYKSGYMTQKEIAEFCMQNQISVVTQGAMKNTQKEICYYQEKNIKAYAFTVNEAEYAKELLEIGYQGIYSDSLKQDDIIKE